MSRPQGSKNRASLERTLIALVAGAGSGTLKDFAEAAGTDVRTAADHTYRLQRLGLISDIPPAVASGSPPEVSALERTMNAIRTLSPEAEGGWVPLAKICWFLRSRPSMVSLHVKRLKALGLVEVVDVQGDLPGVGAKLKRPLVRLAAG